MSFKLNQSQQISLFDRMSLFTEREVKSIKNSWAGIFREEIMPLIDEEPYAALYSGNDASRPNNPINIIIGGLIIKEFLQYSEDYFIESTKADMRIQYALGTTSFKEQPFSDRTFSRFRKSCYLYELETGIDLLKYTITSISDKLAKLMKIHCNLSRMDSMMIHANIKKLTRAELIYVCNQRLAKSLNQLNPDFISENIKHYLDPDDYNAVIYHQKSAETDEKLKKILEESDILYSLGSTHLPEDKNFLNLERVLKEQTIVENGVRRLRTKEDGGMSASMLQNPSDPEATYRKKAGKEHRGYVASVDESVGVNGSIVTDYDFASNTHSDVEFMKDHLARLEPSEKLSTKVVDAAFVSDEVIKEAKDKNVELIATNLTGRETPDAFADFEFDAEGKTVILCAAGHAPIKTRYNHKNEQCTAHFDKSLCEHCPLRDQCRPKINKKTSRVILSKKSQLRAQYQRKMKAEDYKNYGRFRNGVETIPSTLRRRYRLDRLPRGMMAGKFFFGCIIGAFNVKKYINFTMHKGHYAQNPIIIAKS